MQLLDTIGNTPLVEVSGFDTGPCKLFLKLENQNPGGSIKDRIALHMIQVAEQQGVLKPGGMIVEATAGNTGIGLALVATQKGYKLTLVVPDKMSREKINLLKALGASVLLTRSDVERGHPDYYQDLARSIAQKTALAWYADQFSNPANPEAHARSTGPEIWEQMQHSVDAVVVGVGSGGTLGGLTQYFSKVSPKLEMVIADPDGSVVAPYVKTGQLPKECGSWVVEGIGEDFIPANADFSLVKTAYSISDMESCLAARELLRRTGILAGSSSGTLLAAALRYCQAQTSPKRVVSFACDGGSRYLSKMFSNFWMEERGFLPKPRQGDLRDLIARRSSDGEVVTVKPEEMLQTAYARMKLYDVSQLPVLEGQKVIGILDEFDLLMAIRSESEAFRRPVAQFMSTKVKQLAPDQKLDQAIQLLRDGLTVVIADASQFYGLVTMIDVVDFLRTTKPAAA